MRGPKTVAWALARASYACDCSITVFSRGNHGSPRKARKTRNRNRRFGGFRGGWKRRREFCERWRQGRLFCERVCVVFLAAEERGKTRKIAWGRELRPPKGVFGSAGASPSEDRSQHLGRCSLHLRTGFRVEPFFLAAEKRGRTRKIAWARGWSVSTTKDTVFSGWWLPCVAGFTGVVAVLRCFGLVAIA